MKKRLSSIIILSLVLGGAFFPCLAPSSLARIANQVSVRIVSDEADSVLAIIAKQKAGQTVTDADWQVLFATEGYVRLKKREASLKRAFDDSQFKAFVLSEELAGRVTALAATLSKWKRADINAAASRALAYLPKDAHIAAKIYPVIKPQTNSFVFEVKTDPAIFLYLDPDVTKDQFENTLAHELHHIGYGGSCPGKTVTDEIARLPQNARTMIGWISAFGEGFAMLAAAGGPDIHPHAVSKPEDRARWDRDLANFNDDLKKVESFFSDILSDKLSEEQRQQSGFAFFGVQGPWYTVGWKMSVVIEKTYGRAKLIECICDQRKLLPTFNRAATEYNKTAQAPLALWSPSLLEAVEKPSIPPVDRIRLAETFRLGERLGDDVWPGWSKAPFAVLLVMPEYEFLIRHPAPSADFTRLGYDSLLQSDVYYRKRTLSIRFLATFPAVKGSMISTIVVGQAENTSAKTSTPWAITLLHEHFHQLQDSQPNFYQDVNALNLSHGDQSGMWMLNYAFPYDRREVQEQFAAMSQLLSDAIESPRAARAGKLRAYLEARQKFQQLLSPDDYKYFLFQFWKEGIARYTEYQLARLAATKYQPGKEFRALKDYQPFADVAKETREHTLRQLRTQKLGESQREVVYAFGAAEGLLLDEINPGWRKRYFAEKFDVSRFFPGMSH